MSDYNSSLPIRTETNGDAVVRLVDGTVTSQFLSVDASGKISTKLNDGSGTAITSQVNGTQQALDVGINVAGVQIDPRSIRALTSSDVVTANQGTPNTNANGWFVRLTDGTDNATITATGELNVLSAAQPGVDIGDVTVNNGAGAAAVNIQDGGNSITVDGTVSTSNFPSTVDTNFGTVGSSTIRTASQIGNATGAASFGNGATGAQTLRVAANLAVAGADVTSLNPVPVTFDDTPGDQVNDFKAAASIAAAASDNHNYTVTTGKTLFLNQIEGSGSGKAKMEVQVETGVATNTFVSKFVQFNSTATPNMTISLRDPIQVAAGVRVRVIMTNRDNQSQDLYSTISGNEI